MARNAAGLEPRDWARKPRTATTSWRCMREGELLAVASPDEILSRTGRPRHDRGVRPSPDQPGRGVGEPGPAHGARSPSPSECLLQLRRDLRSIGMVIAVPCVLMLIAQGRSLEHQAGIFERVGPPNAASSPLSSCSSSYLDHDAAGAHHWHARAGRRRCRSAKLDLLARVRHRLRLGGRRPGRGDRRLRLPRARVGYCGLCVLGRARSLIANALLV